MMTTTSKWRLEGDYFETCNCETACPCVWLQPSSEGDCKLLVAWHIEKGNLDDLDLGDLNVALACYSPGDMGDGHWQAALYVDERASEHQLAALTNIFGGQLGGHPQILMSFVEEILGVTKVKIDYFAQGKTRRLSIPDIAQAEIEGINGIDGGQSTIFNPPLCVVPSDPSIVAKSKTYLYKDHGELWEFSGRNGYYSSFTYRP